MASKAGRDERYAKQLQKGDVQPLKINPWELCRAPLTLVWLGFQDLALAWSWDAEAALQQYSSSQKRVVPSSACQLLQHSSLKARALMDEQHCRLQMRKVRCSASNLPEDHRVPLAIHTPRDCDLGGFMMRSMMPYSSASLASK